MAGMCLNALVWLVDLSRRHALAVVIGGLLLTAGCAWFTVDHIAITTDTDQIISPDLPWRKLAAKADHEFPQMASGITVVVDGRTPELAAQAADALTGKLAARKDLFQIVYRPDGGDFFARNGLLYLSTKEVGALSDKIAEAQPLLASLVADPSLRGLNDLLNQALQGFERGEGNPAQLNTPLKVFAATLDGVLSGRPEPLLWESLMTGQPPRAEELRRFITAKPILDSALPEPGTDGDGLHPGDGRGARPHPRPRRAGPLDRCGAGFRRGIRERDAGSRSFHRAFPRIRRGVEPHFLTLPVMLVNPHGRMSRPSACHRRRPLTRLRRSGPTRQSSPTGGSGSHRSSQARSAPECLQNNRGNPSENKAPEVAGDVGVRASRAPQTSRETAKSQANSAYKSVTPPADPPVV